MSRAYQPRWLACADALGINPDNLRAFAFTSWITARWREWAEENGRQPGPWSEADHAAFDAWLAERAAR